MSERIDVVVLDDGTTWTGIGTSRVVLDAVYDPDQQDLLGDERTHEISVQELLDFYLAHQGVRTAA